MRFLLTDPRLLPIGRRAGGVALAVALAVSGCAPERWENPNVAASDWADDQQDCQQVAEGTAERQYDLDEQASAERSLDYDAPEEDFEAQMNEGSAEGLDQRTFRRCMLQKGYVLVREKKS